MRGENIRNIFGDIVADENSTTELLRNLMTYKMFRNSILELFLKRGEASQISSEDIETQFTLPGNNGRPDLSISNDYYEILFEIKIEDAGLTSNQPLNYIQHLIEQPKRNKWLVFILPPGYAFLSELKSKLSQTLSKNTRSRINTKILFWDDIIQAIRENDMGSVNVAFKDFLGLLEGWFEIESVPFLNEEVKMIFGYIDEGVKIMKNTTVPGSLIKLYKIIDGLKEYYSKKYKVRIGKDGEEYGLYFQTEKGLDFFYVGVWYAFWAKYGKPISFGINLKKSSAKAQKTFNSLHRGMTEDLDDYRMSWIGEDMLMKENNTKQIIMNIDQDIKRLIGLY